MYLQALQFREYHKGQSGVFTRPSAETIVPAHSDFMWRLQIPLGILPRTPHFEHPARQYVFLYSP